MSESSDGTLNGGIQASAWARLMPTAPVLSSEALSWEKISVYRFRNPKHWQMHQPPLGFHFIAAHVANPSNLSMRLNGRWQNGKTTPGQVILMAALQDNAWEWDGEIDEVHICLDIQILDAVAAEFSDKPVELKSCIGLQDPWIYDIALRLMTEVQAVDITTRLFGDLMAQSLALQLLRKHTVDTHTATTDKMKITRGRLRRALDFVEANLAFDISVDDIASAAAISAFHFSCGFKKAMGLSPYQYVIQRRVERAIELLHNTEESMSQIALNSGFANQSHFTTVFKKVKGVTPLAYRQACGHLDTKCILSKGLSIVE